MENKYKCSKICKAPDSAFYSTLYFTNGDYENCCDFCYSNKCSQCRDFGEITPYVQYFILHNHGIETAHICVCCSCDLLNCRIEDCKAFIDQYDEAYFCKFCGTLMCSECKSKGTNKNCPNCKSKQ